MRRPLIALSCLLMAAAGLVGCSDDDKPPTSSSSAPPAVGNLDKVTVSGGPGEKPTITYGWPYTASVAERRVITEGSGEEVAPGAKVTFDYVTVKGTDGSELESSYGAQPVTVTMDSKVVAGFVQGIIGSKIGSRLIISIPPADTTGVTGGEGEVGGTDTLVVVIDLRAVRHALARATGTPVEPPAGLPTVRLDASGKPTIAVPTDAPPSQLVVQPLIKGDGATVAAGQTVTVHYTGIIWASGRQFDSSWDRGESVNFGIGTGNVIKGWDEGMVGQTIGSQLLLVIPPDKGYGPDGNPQAGITGTDTLVFVVDILDAA